MLLAASLASEARGQNCPTRAHWPTDSWNSRANTVADGRPAELAALDAYVYDDAGADSDATRMRTDTVFIVQNGEAIYDRPRHGYDTSGKRHIAWQVSASVTNVLTGVAVQRGELSLDDSICKFMDRIASDRCAITVRHLLDSASGLEWIDAQDTASQQSWSLPQMLYGDGQRDAARFVVDHPLRAAPGAAWHDSPGDVTLLATVVDAAMQPGRSPSWPWSELLDPIGASYLVLERDRAGRPLGATHFWGASADLARIGFLFINDGCWDGQRLLPEGWVTASTTVQQPYQTRKIDAAAPRVPGRLWWLNRAVSETNTPKPWPRLPDDLYAAIGQGGQLLVVIPSADLVIVRQASDGERSVFDLQEFVLRAMQLAAP